ncbi:MAG TPA: Flp pilus assembly protein CpaB [Candidatus Omnitrophota bacterium]|nr:Flp pilus assembly protein CpaB [Candidatus Omnitrophota bacterium]
MRLSSRSIFFLSVLCALLTLGVIFHVFNELKKDPKAILVATAVRDLDIGDTIGKTDVSLLLMPKGTELSTAFTELAPVVGQNLRNAVQRGNVIRSFDLADETDNIANMIPEGYRATTVSLPISEDALRLLKFGRRVDVVFTDTSAKEFETKTIMKNILVMKAAPMKQAGAQAGGMPGGSTVTVTLAVTPEGAEIMAYAMKKGKLDISIRPFSERDVKDTYMRLDEIVGTKQTSIIPILPEQTEIELYRGVKKEKVKV